MVEVSWYQTLALVLNAEKTWSDQQRSKVVLHLELSSRAGD